MTGGIRFRLRGTPGVATSVLPLARYGPIGGYQVIKKWLSYREAALLDRALRPEEARDVMNIARRIAAIIVMEGELDANYEAVKAKT